MSQSTPSTTESTAALSVDALIELLVREEDRVPREVIEECARRGEAMLDRLEGVLDAGRGWKDDAEPGEWWLLFHTAMILGLMPDARAGELLADLMELIAEIGDENLEDWLADRWAGLFANKPPAVLERLRAMVHDRRLDPHARLGAIEPLLALAARAGRLEEALGAIASLAGDVAEQRSLRVRFAAPLIDFPREAYRALLLDLARRQKADDVVFTAGDVEKSYEDAKDRPAWKARANAWEFYAPEEMADRQRQWAEGDAADEAYPDPYVRQEPKTGRNEPCPCGSGKKYKRCCMPV